MKHNVKSYQRRLKNGKTITVRAYTRKGKDGKSKKILQVWLIPEMNL